MKKNKFYIFFILIGFIFVFFTQYKFLPTDTRYQGENSVKKLDLKLLSSYKQELNISDSIGHAWGFKEDINIPKKTEDIDTNKTVSFSLNKRTICHKKDCFKLIGLFHKKGISYASFYNKNLKNKVKSYQENDMLFKTLKVKKVFDHKVILLDIKTNTSFKMGLFDINITKYKPKVKKEDK